MRSVLPGLMSHIASPSMLEVWMRRYGGFTLFHPLRLVAAGKCSGGSGARLDGLDYEGLASALTSLCRSRLSADARNLAPRMASMPLEGIARVVLHTEYEAPLWCSNSFREAMATAARRALEPVADTLRRRPDGYKLVVELHPGYTRLEDCRLRVGRDGRLYVRCRSAGGTPEESLACLARAKSSMESVLEAVGLTASFTLEPRGSGLVAAPRGQRYPQAAADHRAAAAAAEKLGALIVLDPSQVKGKDGWAEMIEVARANPSIIGEVHVHRNHRTPTQEDLQAYTLAVKEALKAEGEPLGIVGEIVREGGKNLNYQVINEILEAIVLPGRV